MVEELEKLLVEGKIADVQSRLRKISPAALPRKYALKIANISRRAGFHRLAFRILDPIIYPPSKRKSSMPPTAEELSEYGMILFRLGNLAGARNILKTEMAQRCPHSLFYLAFTYFSQWDYQQAKDILEKYVQRPELPIYSKLLGMVNLGQAYIVLEKFDNAMEIINQVIKIAEEKNLHVILANAYQCLADAFVEQGDFKKAQEKIKKLKTLIGVSHYRYNLYVKRIEALSQLPDVKLLRELRSEALRKKHFELARECDLIESLSTKDKDLFCKVYFGTPHKCYRERMLRLWRAPIDLGSHWSWQLNPQKINGPTLDLKTGQVEGTDIKIKVGTSIHKLFSVFASDPYKTFQKEALFALIFPKEKLGKVSSYRVHDTIWRARKWLASQKIDIVINEIHGEFFLTSENGFQIRLELDVGVPSSTLNEYFDQIRKSLGSDSSFGAEEIKTALNISRATANRILADALSSGLVVKMGSGKNTKYQFTDVTFKKIA